MAGFRKPEVPRDQLVLWSQRLDDALPPDHPSRLMDELFSSAAMVPLFAEWEREYHLLEGQPPYHPRLLAALYCYGLLNRLRSSRQLESACHNRIDVIWLMSGQRPDHSTIAAFVTAHQQRVRQLFREVIRVGIKAGLIRMEHISIDGTNIEANAGRGSVHRKSTIRAMDLQIEHQIAELEKEYEGNEHREGLWCVPEGAGLPEGERLRRLRKKRVLMQEALAAMEHRRDEANSAGQTDPKPIASTTDPASRVMKDKEGRRKPNYNAQVAIDTGDAGDGVAGMIVAADVSDLPNDLGQLVEMIDQTRENCGRLSAEYSADAGYNTGRELARLEDLKIMAYVDDKGTAINSPDALDAVRAVREGRVLSLQQIAALPNDPHSQRLDRSCFVYDPTNDTYRCPAGELLTLFRLGRRYDRDGGMERKRYRTKACASCALASRCCKNLSKGREVSRTEFEGVKERMRERMSSEDGKRRYKLRGQSAEPRIGTLKSVMGMRKFLRRGKDKVKLEWQWMCMALNVGVLLRRWGTTKVALN